MVRIIKEVSIFFDSLTEKIDNYYSVLFISLFFFAFIPSCKDDPITPPEAKLQLTVEDVSCTEAWFSVKIENLILPLDIELMNDTLILKTFYSIKSSDTVLYIDSLLPYKSYGFQLANSSLGVKSNIATAVTLDTTSHNFTWQSWTFGDVGSSDIFDIAIINENNIWAVGKITLADTSQNGYTDYNAAHWNGSEWQLKRILYDENFWIIRSIFVFSENDICFSTFVRFDGNNFIQLHIPSILMGWSLNKIWGTSSNDFYVVGSFGKIARYYNRNWYKIESGTDLQFNDIYGAADPKTGELQILAVGSRNNPMGKCIFQIKGNKAVEISTYPIKWELAGIWFMPNRHYYVSGDGIFEKRTLSDSKWANEPLAITRYGTGEIRGNALNDVFVVGAFGECLHYNGVSWKSYLDETGLFLGGYFSVDSKNNIVAAGGYEGIQAKVMLGKRNN